MESALCFHHAVERRPRRDCRRHRRLWKLTRSGCYAYYVGIAHFMAALSLDVPTQRAGSTASSSPGNGGVIWPPPGATACASLDKSLRPRHAGRAAGAWMRSSVEVQDVDRLTSSTRSEVMPGSHMASWRHAAGVTEPAGMHLKCGLNCKGFHLVTGITTYCAESDLPEH